MKTITSNVNSQNRMIQVLLYLEFFPLLLFSYNTSLRGFLYHSDYVVLLTLIVSLLCGFFSFLITERNTPLNLSYFHLGWFAIWCMSIMRNGDLNAAHYGSTIYFSCILLTMLFSSSHITWVSPALRIMYFFSCVHTFVTVFSFFNMDFYNRYIYPILDPSPFINGYKSGLTGHYSTNAMYLGIGLILISAGIISKVKKGTGTKLLALFILFALLLTAKRGILLFSVLSIFIMYLAYHSEKAIKRWGKLFFAFLLTCVFILIISIKIPQVTEVITRFIDTGGDVTNGRIYLYQIAWGLFQKNPLFGIGWGFYKYEFARRTPVSAYHIDMLDAHNVYLQLLCEVGIVGFLLFLTVVIPTVCQTYKILSEMTKGTLKGNDNLKYYLTFSLGIQSFFLMYCFTGNPLYNVQVLFPYVIGCTAFYAIKYCVSPKNIVDYPLTSSRYIISR